MLVTMLALQVYDKHSSRLVSAVKVLTHHQKLSLEARIIEIQQYQFAMKPSLAS